LAFEPHDRSRMCGIYHRVAFGATRWRNAG